MNPVIGLDVSKGQSQGQVFLDKGQPYGKSFSFLHTQEGLHYLLNLINDVIKLPQYDLVFSRMLAYSQDFALARNAEV